MFDPNALPIPDLGLRCRRCSYPLVGLSEHRCSECGDVFSMEDYLPDGAFPPLYAEGGPVRISHDLRDLFEAYHLPFIEIHDPVTSLNIAIGSLVSDKGLPIAVPRERYFEAIDLYRRMRHGEPLPELPLLPEHNEPWQCPQCSEENPPAFDLCWQCGADNPHDGIDPPSA